MAAVEETLKWLGKWGRKIGQMAQEGDEAARRVIVWYNMLYKAPGDPGAQALLPQYVEDLKQAHPEIFANTDVSQTE